jgi:hypothetical protein
MTCVKSSTLVFEVRQFNFPLHDWDEDLLDLIMPERYDDWGNPIRASNHEPIEYSFRGLAKPLARTFREYRAMILWAIVALGLYLFWGSGEPRAPPIDWKQFAYVQYDKLYSRETP